MRSIKKSIISIVTSFSLLTSALTGITTTANASLVNITLPNYPQVSQIGQNCWAYVIKSMLDYKTGTNNSINTIYNAYYNATGSQYVYNSGATLIQAKDVITYLFPTHSPQMSSSALTSNQIQTQIANGRPIYIKGNSTTNLQGHAVALIGFGINIYLNVNKIIYMNTQFETGTNHIDTHSYSNNSADPKYFYNYNHTIEYKWTGSIVLN